MIRAGRGAHGCAGGRIARPCHPAFGRRGGRNALALAEPLDALRPFTHAGPRVRELLVHQLGSFGTTETFAQRALAAGTTDDLPSNHSAHFAPVLQPVLDTGVRAMVAAAMEWLGR